MCRNDVRHVPLRDLCCWSECAWIEVQQSGPRSRRPLLIGCYYRPPKSSAVEVDEFCSLGVYFLYDQPRLVSLVLVSNEKLVGTVDTLQPLGNCDHLPVLCSLLSSLRPTSQSAPRQIWCYDKADFEKLNTTLSKIDWSPVEDAPDIDASWSVWLDIYLGAVRKHVPSKFIKSLKPKLPWMTPSIEQMI